MALEELATARILLADDDEDNLSLLAMSLRNVGASCVRAVSNPFEVVSNYVDFRPDVVVLDFRMPPLDGFQILQGFREADGPDFLVPVIMLTGDASEAIKDRALEMGVADFLQKNFDMAELLLRVRNVVRMSQLYRQVQRQKTFLEETVRVRTRQLQAARREVLERLAMAAEFRDDQTGEHTRRVGHLSAQIAQRMGQSTGYVEAIGAAALLHDLGKIGVPDSLLLKRGPLTDPEFEQMRQHTVIGAAILLDCNEPVMRMAREIALSHHERWDGFGYPHNLSGEDIPLSGRIVSVADAFDAMTSERPYKAARHRSEAIKEIADCSGRQFDPEVVSAFLAVIQNWSGLHGLAVIHARGNQPELLFDA